MELQFFFSFVVTMSMLLERSSSPHSEDSTYSRLLWLIMFVMRCNRVDYLEIKHNHNKTDLRYDDWLIDRE